MRCLKWKDLDPKSRTKALLRPNVETSKLETVLAIVEDVKTRGDRALLEYTRHFDSCALDDLRTSDEEIAVAVSNTPLAIVKALEKASANIKLYHSHQLRDSYRVEVSNGILLSREVRPLRQIGLYIPAGTAPLVSTLLMTAIPARLAGCEDIILCTPPGTDGRLSEVILLAAAMFGIEKIFKVGGAQAIAAMAYGTQTIPKVDKIFGPGNIWVNEAKRIVSQDSTGAAIDIQAGPSELLIVCDSSCNPKFVAADLLSQAEHGADSQVILVTLNPLVIPRIMDELEAMQKALSRRLIIQKAMEHALILIAEDRDEALEIIEAYAPEHLSLQVKEPDELIPFIYKAGSIFCGSWTPESAGDYASGTNHVLPTGGWARSQSGLSVESFQRTMSVQTLSPDGLRNLSETLRVLTDVERLDAHKNAVEVRLAEMKTERGMTMEAQGERRS